MHPTIAIFRLAWIDWVVQVDAYPLAHLLAFLAMLTVTMRLYARDVGPPAKLLDVFLLAVPAALLGAHFVAGWTSGHPVRNPFDTLGVYRVLDAWSSASKSAYGGLSTGLAVATLVAWWHRLPLGMLLDAAAPGLALGAAIARLGCFLGGCCYGRPTGSFLGVHFPDGHLGMAKLPAGDPRGLHPTQLYLAAAGLSIAAIVMALRRFGERRPGDVFRVGTALYAASTFAIEFLRDDPGRWFGAGLSHSQWISLAVLLLLSATGIRRSINLRTPRRIRAAATLLVVGLAAGTARADEPAIPASTLMDVVGRSVVDGTPGALLVLGRLLEIGGGGPLGTWSRIGLGASQLLEGNLAGAVAEWRGAAAAGGGTPWGAQAELAVGLGEVMSGRPDAAIAAFRTAEASGEGETVAFVALSLGRVLAATGDTAAAEASFRRVLTEHPRSTLADDAALGLARVLVHEGRLAEADAVLREARRYERDGSYRQGGRDPALRWDTISLLGERRLATLLRRRAARAVENGRPVLDELLAAITDRYAGPELRRLRVRVARLVATGAPVEPHPAPRPALRSVVPPAAGAPARETTVVRAARFYAGRALVVLALALLALAVLARRERRSGACVLLLVAGAAAAAVPDDAIDLGRCPPGMPAGPLVLVLPLRDPEGLARLLHDQHDPGSPGYHRWLTPAEFGARFGAPEPEYRAAADWLESQGFTVRRWAGRAAVGFDGTAGQVERAFGSALHLRSWRGRRFHVPSHDPVLRTFGQTRVRAVLGLDTFARPQPLLSVRDGNRLAPADLHTVFGLGSVFAQGITGRGSAIAVLATSDFATDDVAQFRATFGLPPAIVTKRFVSGNPGSENALAVDEVLLDTEWSGAVAPEAELVAVIGGESVAGFTEAALLAVNENVAPVVSVSFGVCEPLAGRAVADLVNDVTRQAAAQGQTVVVASGDDGASDCNAVMPGMTQAAVNVLAASPFVTAVGGTSLDPLFDVDGNARGYGGEAVWNDSAVFGRGASGGGRSVFFARPDYQARAGIAADVGRAVPDVAFAASPLTPGYALVAEGSLAPGGVGGTSASAPVWAGLVALLEAHRGERLGLVNTELYRLGARQALGTGPAVFHDVTRGANGLPGAPGFPAAPGFDLATGWGSFDAPAMVAAFGTCRADADCDDGIECTEDRCTPGGCSNMLSPDGTPCGVEEPCLVRQCRGGVCAAMAGCDDNDPCTWDACTPEGRCAHGPVSGTTAVSCQFARPALSECGGSVPARVARHYARARALIMRATATKPGAEPPRLVKKALRALAKATRAARRADRKGDVSADCAAALLETLARLRAAARDLLSR